MQYHTSRLLRVSGVPVAVVPGSWDHNILDKKSSFLHKIFQIYISMPALKSPLGALKMTVSLPVLLQRRSELLSILPPGAYALAQELQHRDWPTHTMWEWYVVLNISGGALHWRGYSPEMANGFQSLYKQKSGGGAGGDHHRKHWHIFWMYL